MYDEVAAANNNNNNNNNNKDLCHKKRSFNQYILE